MSNSVRTVSDEVLPMPKSRPCEWLTSRISGLAKSILGLTLGSLFTAGYSVCLLGLGVCGIFSNFTEGLQVIAKSIVNLLTPIIFALNIPLSLIAPMTGQKIFDWTLNFIPKTTLFEKEHMV